MKKTYDSAQWHALGADIFNLIMIELDTVSRESLPQVYPKLVVMYEFFRLIRGEAFGVSRPSGLGDLQGNLYDMEITLMKRIAELEKELDPHDEGTRYYLDLMKKLFDLNHFSA